MTYIIIASLLAVLSWSFVDAVSKLYINRFGKELSSLILLAIGIIPMLLLAMISPYLGNIFFLLFIGLVGGLVLFLGYILVYKSVPSGGVSNSYILLEVQPIILILFGIFVLGEHIGIEKAASIILVFVGISFVMLSKKFKLDKQLVPALTGNVMWAIYWAIIILAFLYYKNFVLPLLFARMFGALFAYLYYKAKPPKNYYKISLSKSEISIILILILAGLFDGFGNISFAFVSFSNKVVLGSAILSSEPIIIWLIGLIAYHEKITVRQKFGFLVATIGYLLFTLL
ncbi:MAG: DMT family transporter [Candidatus Micrarchaeota archaeon]